MFRNMLFSVFVDSEQSAEQFWSLHQVDEHTCELSNFRTLFLFLHHPATNRSLVFPTPLRNARGRSHSFAERPRCPLKYRWLRHRIFKNALAEVTYMCLRETWRPTVCLLPLLQSHAPPLPPLPRRSCVP